jgi:heat shock protein HslJ
MRAVSTRIIVVTLSLAMLTLAPACATAEASTLEGTSWVLELPDAPADASLVPVEVTLSFVSHNAIEGTYGLQKYAGGYAVEDDGITFNTLCFTTLACMAAGGTLNAEQEYLFDLEAATSYAVEGERLTIFAGESTLVYTRR